MLPKEKREREGGRQQGFQFKRNGKIVTMES